MFSKEFVLEQLLDVTHLPVLLSIEGIDVARLTAKRMVETFQSHGKLICVGEGNFKNLVEHLASEFKSGLIMKRPALPVVVLKKEPSSPNKEEDSLLNKLRATAEAKDTLLILTGEGSEEVKELTLEAVSLNINTLILCGYPKPKDISPDYLFYIPVSSRPRLEEVFLVMGHIICTLVESILFSEGNGL